MEQEKEKFIFSIEQTEEQQIKERQDIVDFYSGKMAADARERKHTYNAKYNPTVTEEQIKLIDLSEQKILRQDIGKLTLTDTYILLEVKFLAEEIDKDEELEMTSTIERHRYGFEKYFKKDCCGIYVTRTSSDIYKMMLPVNGVPEDLVIYFDDKKECMRIKDIIDKWLFN